MYNIYSFTENNTITIWYVNYLDVLLIFFDCLNEGNAIIKYNDSKSNFGKDGYFLLKALIKLS